MMILSHGYSEVQRAYRRIYSSEWNMGALELGGSRIIVDLVNGNRMVELVPQ